MNQNSFVGLALMLSTAIACIFYEKLVKGWPLRVVIWVLIGGYLPVAAVYLFDKEKIKLNTEFFKLTVGFILASAICTWSWIGSLGDRVF